MEQNQFKNGWIKKSKLQDKGTCSAKLAINIQAFLKNRNGKSYFAVLLYLLLKRSTLPVVSTSFCVPVKNGWHAEQISTLRFFAVLFVLITLPHEQWISCS